MSLASVPSTPLRVPKRLARLVVAALLVALALQLLNAILSGFELKLIFDGLEASLANRPPPNSDELDFYIYVAGQGWVLSNLVTAALALTWIYRVDRNAHLLADGLAVRPAWAVGWYFIPIAGLWMPFRALREAWQASVDPEGWTRVPVPPALRWWWGLWLVTTHLTALSMAASLVQRTVGEALQFMLVDIVTALISIPQTLLFIHIVRRLTGHQTSQSRARAFD